VNAVRRVVGQVGIDVPARMPGGVWGAPALTFRLAYDGNGNPAVSWGPGSPFVSALAGVQVPADIAARTAARAEQPWPQAWVAQIGVTSAPAAPQPPVTWPEVEYEVLLGVESASFALLFGVPWNGTQTALLPLELGSAQAIQFVAQQVQVRPRQVRPVAPDQGLAGFATSISVAWLIGLASPPHVVVQP
jgi:hypothetical protein